MVFYVPDGWLFCVVVNLVIFVSQGLLYIFVVVSAVFFLNFVFSLLVKRWLGRTSPKWPILCRVGCKNLKAKLRYLVRSMFEAGRR